MIVQKFSSSVFDRFFEYQPSINHQVPTVTAPGTALNYKDHTLTFSQLTSPACCAAASELMKRFMQELLFRRSHLRLRHAEIERLVEPCLVCLICDGKMLVRTHEELEDGRVRERATLLTSKKMPEETWQSAAGRACADELDMEGLKVDFEQANYQFFEERRESPSMPGIATCFGLHLITLEVSQQFADGLAVRRTHGTELSKPSKDNLVNGTVASSSKFRGMSSREMSNSHRL